MSDGKSSNKIDTLAALEEVHEAIQMPNLTIFVVGVGNVDLQEVLAIAFSTSTFNYLDTFQDTTTFAQIRDQQSYRIRYTGNIVK